MTPSTQGPTGTFRYTPSTGTWTWSDEVFAIFGFAQGDVVPTTDLIAAHLHPEDHAAGGLRLITESVETGRPCSVWHRVVDAQGNSRQVILLSVGEFTEDGVLRAVTGFLVDVTDAVRRTASREVDEAMELMSRSRPIIEQAKGALMHAYRLDADRAFTLLRRYSQLVNVKVREVAQGVVDALPGGGLPARATWDDLADAVREDGS